MKKFIVWCNSCEFGEIEAADAQEARDKAAQMAGYLDENDLIGRMGYSDIMTREAE